MTIDPEFTDFVRRWLKKADDIELFNLEDYFDKYFTLFVAYNLAACTQRQHSFLRGKGFI